jgi:hypothetical protein
MKKSAKKKVAKQYGPNRAYALAVTRWAAHKAVEMGDCCNHQYWAWARLVSDTHVKTCGCSACFEVRPERGKPEMARGKSKSRK